MKVKLTKLQAYNAMVKFLDIYYEQTKSDDVGSLLGGMSFLSDDSTADPAAWEDWTDSINAYRTSIYWSNRRQLFGRQFTYINKLLAI